MYTNSGKSLYTICCGTLLCINGVIIVLLFWRLMMMYFLLIRTSLSHHLRSLAWCNKGLVFWTCKGWKKCLWWSLVCWEFDSWLLTVLTIWGVYLTLLWGLAIRILLLYLVATSLYVYLLNLFLFCVLFLVHCIMTLVLLWKNYIT